MQGVTIRVAHAGDGPGLAQLHLDTAASLHGLDPSRFRIPDTEGLAEWLDEDLATIGKTWMCFVALEDTQIVGQVEARLHEPMETARFQVMTELSIIRGEVNSLGVFSSRRRRGIGTALMARAEEWLRNQGARVIRLDTYIKSPESMPFYEAIGYRRVAIIFERRPAAE
jgi:GNAT superfamily N-acetyltransferase